MRSFDTVHLLAPIEGLISYETEQFKGKADLDDEGNRVATVYSLKRGIEKPLGLDAVSIQERGVDLTFSAKILGTRYHEGLNLETIEQVVPALRPIIDLEPQSLLDAVLWRIDCTDNIRPKNLRRTILTVGTLGSLNSRYRYEPYGSTQEQGFVFAQRIKERAERIIGYNKELEMNRNGKTALALGVENFSGVLRWESNLRSRKLMRNLLGMDETYTLLDALNTDRNPNLALFEKIVGQGSDMLAEINKLHRTDGEGVNYFKNLGIDRVIEAYSGNWKAIEKHIRLQYNGKSNPSRFLKKVKQRVALYHARQIEAEQLLDEVSEVRELLKVA